MGDYLGKFWNPSCLVLRREAFGRKLRRDLLNVGCLSHFRGYYSLLFLVAKNGREGIFWCGLMKGRK